MIRIRIRKDGVRELKVDDEVHEIPHDHELAPNPTFATAYREKFLVDPLTCRLAAPTSPAPTPSWTLPALRI